MENWLIYNAISSLYSNLKAKTVKIIGMCQKQEHISTVNLAYFHRGCFLYKVLSDLHQEDGRSYALFATQPSWSALRLSQSADMYPRKLPQAFCQQRPLHKCPIHKAQVEYLQQFCIMQYAY